ncbi:uncharacterized protein METZ01_LOCUS269924, partial [marine metagenome]
MTISSMTSTFYELFSKTSWDETAAAIRSVTPDEVERALSRRGAGGLEDFRALIS